MLFRQGKYAIPGTSLSAIGGLSEPYEDAAVTARREALEETGLECSQWHEYGRHRVDANRGVGTCSTYFASGCMAKYEVEQQEHQKKGNKGQQRGDGGGVVVSPAPLDGGDLEELGLVLCTTKELARALAGDADACGASAVVQELKWSQTLMRVVGACELPFHTASRHLCDG